MTAIAVGTLALLLVLGTVASLFADDVSVKGFSGGTGHTSSRTRVPRPTPVTESAQLEPARRGQGYLVPRSGVVREHWTQGRDNRVARIGWLSSISPAT